MRALRDTLGLSLVAVVALAAVASGGCGSGDRTHAVARRAHSGCSRAVAAAVGTVAHARAVRAASAAASPGVRVCRYAAVPGGALLATVTLDSNPQASFRFTRSVVERAQNALWSHRPREVPRRVRGIGRGADWLPAERVLLATDGTRLVSVAVPARRDGERLARAAARAALSPGASGARSGWAG
jgi:hypothetical protein